MKRFELKGGQVTSDHRLDRVIQFDEKSREFPIRALVGKKKPRSYTWGLGTHLDQGEEGACTGFSVAHEIAARPRPVLADSVLALRLYHRARQLDEWPGEEYDGSSVLASVKAATELGYFKEYRWAFGIDDLLAAVSNHGPAVLGINWYDGMHQPDEKGVIRVAGDVSGGHAILANGVSLSRKMVRLENSWGDGWGIGGACWIPIDDLARLLDEDGEVCVPVVRASGRP